MSQFDSGLSVNGSTSFGEASHLSHRLKSLLLQRRLLSVFTPSNYSRLRTEKWPRQDGCERGTQGRQVEKEQRGSGSPSFDWT